MTILKNLALSAVVAVLATACGGGGGSPGETHGPYSVMLTADRVQLPVNTGHQGPGIGVYSPYTTTIYVKATENGSPIPGGDKIFGCNVDGGLNVGALYYLDGDTDHETTDKNGNQIPNAYRSITLGSNSGGNSFHFHAGDTAGTATITCSAQSPQDKKYYSASIVITVGAASGKVASITGNSQSNVLGTQGNFSNLPTSTNINVRLLDDAAQLVPDSGVQNVQVSIRSGVGAGAGARLMAGGQSGSTLWLGTTGGIANFSLSSGVSEGAIILDITADRSDNDVTNGIQDPVIGVLVISVSNQVATDPVTIAAATLPGGAANVPYSYVFSATGGLAPYTWSATGLPPGLTMGADGTLSGAPSQGGTFNFVVRVADSQGKTASLNVSLTVTPPPAPPAPPAPALAIGGCSGATCTLPAATDAVNYSYTLWTTGGSGTTAPAWSLVGLVPANVAITGTGTLTWTPAACALKPAAAVTVSVTKGSDTLVQSISIPVTQAGGAACP